MRRFVFGKKKYESFSIELLNTTKVSLRISTRVGNVYIDKGDGSSLWYVTTPKMYSFPQNNLGAITFTYSAPFTGFIRVYVIEGLSDVYSIGIGPNGVYSGETDNRVIIQNIGSFMKQFVNLYSMLFFGYAYGTNSIRPRIYGNINEMPDSLEEFYSDSESYDNGIHINLDLNELSSTSQLKKIGISAATKIRGDIGKLPSLIRYIRLTGSITPNLITYNGKTWNNVFDSFVIGNNINLGVSAIDMLYNDLLSTVTSVVGVKEISYGFERSSNSDLAVQHLLNLGVNGGGKTLYNPLIHSKEIRYIRDTEWGHLTNNSNFWTHIVATSGGVNIALGLPAKVYTSTGVLYATTYLVTDGINWTSYNVPTSGYSIVVDLGSLVSVDSVGISRYSDGRKYRALFEISPDGSTWYVLFVSGFSYYPENGIKTYTL